MIRYFLLFVLALIIANSIHAQADSLTQLAAQAQNQGNFALSTSYYRQICSDYESEENWKASLDVQNQIARNYWKAKKVDSSLIVSNKIHRSPHLEKGSLTEAELLSNLGVVYDMKKEYSEALSFFHKCLKIRQIILGDDHIETGKVYYNIGACYNLQGQYRASLEYGKKALRNFKKNLPPKHPFFIAVYSGMQNPYNKLGLYDQMIQMLEFSIEIASVHYPPNHPAINGMYTELGLAKLKTKGREKEGLADLLKSYHAANQYYGKEHPNMIRLNTNLSATYSDLKQWDNALKYAMTAKKIALKTIGKKNESYYSANLSLGNIYTLLENDSVALAYFHEALLATLPTVADTFPIDQLPDLANVKIPNIIQFMNAYSRKARTLYRLSVKDSTYKKVYASYLSEVDIILKRSLQKLDDPPSRNKFLESAYQYAASKAQFGKQESDPIFVKSAIESIDNSKSLLLKMALSTDKAMKMGGIPDSITQEEEALQQLIDQIEQQLLKNLPEKNKQAVEEELFQAKNKYALLEQSLKKEFPQYFNLKYTTHNIQIEEIQNKLLDEKTLLIEYMFDQDFLYIATISKNNYTLDFFKRDEVFERNLENFRKHLCDLSYIKSQKDNGILNFSSLSYFLYQKLLEKSLTDTNITNLILIPDGELNRIPFETLLYNPIQQEKLSFQSLPFLIKRYTIRYAYSASLLLDAMDNNANTSNTILAFASSYDPKSTTNPMRKELIPLEGIKEEVQTLKKQFEGDFYLSEKATESVIKQIDFSQFSVLHLAMHGLLNREHPMQSAMAFTEDTSSLEDGFLYAHEITNMNIPTNLVVLSACETGDGKHQKIEGIMSLGRSFMYAGTPSIVMSLWQVSDFSTAQIMQKFYQNLAEGQSKSEALRNAKFHYLELIKNNKDVLSHPFFWAAFINLGDDSSIQLNQRFNYTILLFIGLIVCLLLIASMYLRKTKAS